MAIKKFNTIAGLSVGENASIDVIDGVGNVTANNLTTTGLTNLGNVGNVQITGGNSGYVLSTDGTGNLNWITNDAGAAGANYQVQYNLGGQFATNANFAFNPDTETLTSTNFSGNGSQLTNVTAVTANYANYAGTAYSVTGSNVSGQVANALIAATVYSNDQPNITSVGTLNSLSVTANITAGNVTGANLVSANYFAGTITTNAQPNITSIGTLSNLAVTGNISFTQGISANGDYGNRFDGLTSDGNGKTSWQGRYFYSEEMYDFTAYGMGYMNLPPNQDPVTLGFLANVDIPYGSVFILVTNDGLTDPAPITIYSPSSKTTPMMWVTIDGNGPYDPNTNPGGSDYWFNITPPA